MCDQANSDSSSNSQAGYAILATATPWIFQPIENFVLPLLCSCDVVLLIVTGILYFLGILASGSVPSMGCFILDLKTIFIIPQFDIEGMRCYNKGLIALLTFKFLFDFCRLFSTISSSPEDTSTGNFIDYSNPGGFLSDI